MQARIRLFVLPLALLSAPMMAGAADAADPPLARAAWLAGCWQAEGGEPGSQEHWLAPAGASMLGVSRTVVGQRTAFFEFMQLRVDEQGRLVFIAHPGGRAGTSFVQAASAGDALAFENPRAEFPQRIVYRRLAADKLLASIEGLQDGRSRQVEFPMTRAACDNPTPLR